MLQLSSKRNTPLFTAIILKEYLNGS